ncbi:uncharacterized protein EI90DRAFT_3020500 [Cantharellus anzutake]|uniref:uncharacterized protein n=1 Tax=Cantharellus anzutake TaxID=1750568 RepID=UPI001904E1A2|nr:uncharacterized protein EI90DRAFT_3020500 [Cantharellus anzutake]KAF8320578.1 hypothetical protein EI90DRAFT_3020500 [Cantharellus anzutake]
MNIRLFPPKSNVQVALPRYVAHEPSQLFALLLEFVRMKEFSDEFAPAFEGAGLVEVKVMTGRGHATGVAAERLDRMNLRFREQLKTRSMRGECMQVYRFWKFEKERERVDWYGNSLAFTFTKMWSRRNRTLAGTYQSRFCRSALYDDDLYRDLAQWVQAYRITHLLTLVITWLKYIKSRGGGTTGDSYSFASHKGDETGRGKDLVTNIEL